MSRALLWAVPLIGVLLHVAALGVIYSAGVTAGGDAAELAATKREVAAEREHLKNLQALQADMDSLELRAAQTSARLKAAQTTHQQELIRYAQEHRDDGCRLDADGLRLWRAANARAHPDTERDAVDAAGLPASAAAAGRDDAGAADQPLGPDGPVPGVRGQASGTGVGDVPAASGAGGALQ